MKTRNGERLNRGTIGNSLQRKRKQEMALTIVREKRMELVSKYNAVGKAKSPRPLAGKGKFFLRNVFIVRWPIELRRPRCPLGDIKCLSGEEHDGISPSGGGTRSTSLRRNKTEKAQVIPAVWKEGTLPNIPARSLISFHFRSRLANPISPLPSLSPAVSGY